MRAPAGAHVSNFHGAWPILLVAGIRFTRCRSRLSTRRNKLYACRGTLLHWLYLFCGRADKLCTRTGRFCISAIYLCSHRYKFHTPTNHLDRRRDGFCISAVYLSSRLDKFNTLTSHLYRRICSLNIRWNRLNTRLSRLDSRHSPLDKRRRTPDGCRGSL